MTRVAEARRRADTLADLGRRLVDHFASEAELGGATASDVRGIAHGSGEARNRRPANPFERFTDLHRHSIVLAQEIARSRPGSEQRVRTAIVAMAPPPGEVDLQGHIGFAPDSKAAIEGALP